MRYHLQALSLAAALAVGCSPQPTEPDPGEQGFGDAPSDHESAAADVMWLQSVAAAHVEPRDVPSWEKTRAQLDDEAHAPVREALSKAGFSEREQAALVSLSAGYGSGQPWDPVRARGEDAQQQWTRATEELLEAIERAEERSGEELDRTELMRAVFPALRELDDEPF